MSKDGASRTRPSKRRNQAGPKHKKGPSNDRWILSYADFMTLLFAFFVALYSISIENSGDQRLITETLEGVFDAVQKSIKPISIGEPTTSDVESDALFEVDPDENNKAEDPGVNAPELQSEVFNQLSQMVANQLQDYQSAGLISISENTQWIEVDLKAGLLFGAGEYELTNDAVAVLMSLTTVLKRFPSPIIVEGHTDDLPLKSVQYSSNWHLSASRAASVVDEMVYQGMNPDYLAPIGFSSMVPKVRNTNEFARERNRRVTLKVSKSNSENIYAFLFD